MFSGAVKLEDINDFISPSQACVVPIVSSVKKDSKPNPTDKLEKVSVSADTIRPDLIKMRKVKRKERGAAEKGATKIVANGLNLSESALPITVAANEAVTPSEAVSEEAETTAAQVSLYDCLACSGCVTTAEAVLIQDQSIHTFLERIKQSRLSAVSVSSESLELISRHYQLPSRSCFRRLAWVFKVKLGISIVLDTSISDAYIQTETLREFLHRFSSLQHQSDEVETSNEPHEQLTNNINNQSPSNPQQDTSSQNGDHNLKRQSVDVVSGISQSSISPSSPLLTSHCPGWICFVEKSQPQSVVNAVSKLKTSQQILGHLLKTLTIDAINMKTFFFRYLSEHPIFTPPFVKGSSLSHATNFLSSSRTSEEYASNQYTGRQANPLNDNNVHFNNCDFLTSKDIYHAAIMPCYDKKLETARSESIVNVSEGLALGSQNNEEVVAEVDTVLATTEVFTLLNSLDINLNQIIDDLGICDDVCYGTSDWPIWETTLPQLSSDVLNILRVDQGGMDCITDFNTTMAAPMNSQTDFKHPSPYCLCCHTIRCVHENDASGGFLEYTFRQATRILFGISLENKLMLTPLGNKDMKEICLKVDGQIRLRFALAYGFRNIQNIVRPFSRHGNVHAKEPNHRNAADDVFFDFVEVMACPRGCRYGGGQVEPPEENSKTTSDSTEEERLRRIDTIVRSDWIVVPPHRHPLLIFIYRYILFLDQLSQQSKRSTMRDYQSLSCNSLRCLVNEKREDFVGLNELRW